MPARAAAPGSPPKRMTRARAKAVDTTAPSQPVEVKTPVADILTPAAKAAATKRKTRGATHNAEEEDEEDELAEVTKRNTSRNVELTAGEGAAAVTVAKRGRPGSRAKKAEVVAVEKQEDEVHAPTPAPAKRGRGRPKKAAVEQVKAELGIEAEFAPTPVAARAAQTVAAPARKPVADKKKVTFSSGQVAEDASNEEQVTAKETQARGIKAKPTRRAGAKSAFANSAMRATPKKVETVASITPKEVVGEDKDIKMASVSSRDELDDVEEVVAPQSTKKPAIEQPPPTGLASPAKRGSKMSSYTGTASSMMNSSALSPKKDAPIVNGAVASPSKLFGTSLLGSPAKRPPQSPLRNTFKASPVKVGSDLNHPSAAAQSPAKESMLSKSPKKFAISTIERKPMGLAAPLTDFKRSLFASPPKRAFTPSKPTAAGPLSKSGLSLMSAMTSTAHRPISVTSSFSTPSGKMVASSAFASRKSPAASAKVHKMTAEERDEMVRMELESAPSPFTPAVTKKSKTPKQHRAAFVNELRSAPAPFTPAVPQLGLVRPVISRVTSTGSVGGTPKAIVNVVSTPKAITNMQSSGLSGVQESGKRKSLTGMDGSVRHAPAAPHDRTLLSQSTTPEGTPAKSAMQALATPARIYRNIEVDSDDELSASTSRLSISPQRVAPQTPMTPVASYTKPTLASHSKAGPMTVLANRFGTWKTATPDAKVAEQRKLEKPLFAAYAKTPTQNGDVAQNVAVTPAVVAQQLQTPRAAKSGALTPKTTSAEIEALAPGTVDQKSASRKLITTVKKTTTFALGTPNAPRSVATPKTVKAPQTVAADRFHLPPPPSSIDEESIIVPSPEKYSQFEEAMAILEDSHDISFSNARRQSNMSNAFRASQMSDASQVYGDENEIPLNDDDADEDMFDFNHNTPIAAPSQQTMKIITPARSQEKTPRVIHTTTKVPLKPSADFDSSPLARPTKRSQSLLGPLSPQTSKDLRVLREIPVRFDSSPVVLQSQKNNNIPAIVAPPHTPTQDMNNDVVVTPIRTPRADLNSKLLAGAIVYVDAYTTEGAEASAIFVELLTQMGAKCVRQWAWNPETEGETGGEDRRKVGITHVVFKDGGKRTMEKVRAAKGVVVCVGVKWVLDCEAQNTWLDESAYAIDTATVPRGGHRRRKSMEPKALTNLNGSLIGTEALSKSPSLQQQFLNLDSPVAAYTNVNADTGIEQAPVTPTPETYVDPSFYGDSPTTPYFLHPQQLVQRTCPPKQTGQENGFDVPGKGGDEKKAAAVRQRLALMRRRTLEYAPRVGSPLARV